MIGIIGHLIRFLKAKLKEFDENGGYLELVSSLDTQAVVDDVEEKDFNILRDRLIRLTVLDLLER